MLVQQQRCKSSHSFPNLLIASLFFAFFASTFAQLPSDGPSSEHHLHASRFTYEPHVNVESGDALLDALLDPTVQGIQVLNDLDMTPTWPRWEAMEGNLVLTRSVAIFGPGSGAYPIINFRFWNTSKGIWLNPNVEIIFAQLMLKQNRGASPDMVKDGDCSSTVIMYDCIWHQYASPPATLILLAVNSQPKPIWAPSMVNTATILDHGFCSTNQTHATCWKTACWVTCGLRQFSYLGLSTPGCLQVLVYGVVVVVEQVINTACLSQFYRGNTTCMYELSKALQAAELTLPRRAPTKAEIQAAAQDEAALPPLPDPKLIIEQMNGSKPEKTFGVGSQKMHPPSTLFIIGLSVGLVVGVGLCASLSIWLVRRQRRVNRAATTTRDAEAGTSWPDDKSWPETHSNPLHPDTTATSRRSSVSEQDRPLFGCGASLVTSVEQTEPSLLALRIKSLVPSAPHGEFLDSEREIAPADTARGTPKSAESFLPVSATTTISRQHTFGAVSMSKMSLGTVGHANDEWQVHVLGLGQVVTDTLPLGSDINMQVDLEADIAFGEMLGSGSMGTVYSGTYRADKVAVKVFHPGADLRTFAQEISILGRTQHPNVVQLLGVSFNDAGPVALLEELCHGSCEQLLYAAAQLTPDSDSILCAAQRAARKQAQARASALPALPCPLPLSVILSIALQTANGLAYLHPTVIHRDLKPGNILLLNRGTRPAYGPGSGLAITRCSTASSSMGMGHDASDAGPSSACDESVPMLQVKLSDFGLSRMRDAMTIHTQRPYCGTVPYMAPECFTRQPSGLTHKVDIYALGSCLWEMLHGIRPWQGFTPAEMMYQVAVRNTRPPIMVSDERCPRQLRKLIMRCWDSDPDRRPSALEVARELAFIQRQLGYGT